MRPACASCGTSLRWVRSATTGTMMPLEADSDPASPTAVVAIEANLLGETIGRIVGPTTGEWIPHFAVCPYADQHRRPRRRGRRVR